MTRTRPSAPLIEKPSEAHVPRRKRDPVSLMAAAGIRLDSAPAAAAVGSHSSDKCSATQTITAHAPRTTNLVGKAVRDIDLAVVDAAQDDARAAATAFMSATAGARPAETPAQQAEREAEAAMIESLTALDQDTREYHGIDRACVKSIFNGAYMTAAAEQFYSSGHRPSGGAFKVQRQSRYTPYGKKLTR